MSTRSLGALAGVVALAVVGSACSGSADATSNDDQVPISESADGPRFITPSNGDEVTTPVEIVIDPGPVDPSGETVAADAGGRFHILVDEECLANGEVFPKDDPRHHVLEFGATSIEIELPEGAHELCLQFGNAFDAAFYATDTVTVRVLG